MKTRVPGRTPEQTTRRLAPAHLTGGRPPAGHVTRRQAQDALADVLAEERRRVGQRAYDHGPATFADAAAGYLHHVESVKGRERTTVSDYRGSIERYLNPRWGELPIEAIAAEDVEALRDELLAAGLSARTVVRHLTVAHGVFRFAFSSHQVWGVEVGEVTGGGGREPARIEAAEAVAFHRSHQRADVGGGGR